MKISLKIIFPTMAVSLALGASPIAHAQGQPGLGGGPGGGFGGPGGFGHSHHSTGLIADVTAAPGGIGQGEFRYVTSKKQSSLGGGVSLPVDGKTLDSNGAVGATVILTLADSAGTTCTLQPSDIRFSYPASGPTEEIDYALAGRINSKNSTTNFSIGNCTGGVLPTITHGETITVTVASMGGNTITTLTGTFK
ncbi:MAG: hypothetical protein PHE55_06800 [Methylococcaceae bacterium]|nr:hypothetical protein [Methylococcaceae bacterium]